MPPVAARRGCSMSTATPELKVQGQALPARRRLFVAAAIFLPAIALLALLAYGFRTDSHYIPSPLIGKPAPPFALTLFDGNALRLGDLRGNVVFLNFWASWCVPCREEAPALETAWQAYRPRGVVFVGINIQDKEQDARAFLDEFSITYANGVDPGSKIAVDYGVYGIPETFVIDRGGRISYKHIGAITSATLATKLDQVLAGETPVSEGRGDFRTVQ